MGFYLLYYTDNGFGTLVTDRLIGGGRLMGDLLIEGGRLMGGRLIGVRLYNNLSISKRLT